MGIREIKIGIAGIITLHEIGERNRSRGKGASFYGNAGVVYVRRMPGIRCEQGAIDGLGVYIDDSKRCRTGYCDINSFTGRIRGNRRR